MSTRIDQTFARLKAADEGALVAFLTAGDPSVEHTPELVTLLAEAGADIIELGIPYSDPLADGPSIQASSQRALDRGVTPPKVLDMVRRVRERSDVPIVLMTSYNLVLRCGLTRFAEDAQSAGADGTILTDLPPEEAHHWREASQAHGLATIFLVAPTSTPARIRTIAENTTGFVYCVSRTGVTGAKAEMTAELQGFWPRCGPRPTSRSASASASPPRRTSPRSSAWPTARSSAAPWWTSCTTTPTTPTRTSPCAPSSAPGRTPPAADLHAPRAPRVPKGSSQDVQQRTVRQDD